MPHGRVKMRSKAEGKSRLGEAALYPAEPLSHFDPEGGQHVGAATRAGNCPVAMLDDRHAGGSGYEGRGRTDVERSRRIAARPAGVEDTRAAGLERDHV